MTWAFSSFNVVLDGGCFGRYPLRMGLAAVGTTLTGTVPILENGCDRSIREKLQPLPCFASQRSTSENGAADAVVFMLLLLTRTLFIHCAPEAVSYPLLHEVRLVQRSWITLLFFHVDPPPPSVPQHPLP